jgi:Xaa-Pro aminopeptidase
MKDLISSFYKNNRIKLQGSCSPRLLVVRASDAIQKSADQAYPFYQNSDFWYLTGLNFPGLILVIAPNEHFLIVPTLSKYKQIFDGQIDREELISKSAVDTIYNQTEGYFKLKQLLLQYKEVGLPSPYLRLREFQILNAPYFVVIKRLLSRLANHKLKYISINRELAQMRMIKQPIELEFIQKAIDITISGMELVLANLKQDSAYSKPKVLADLSYSFLSRGSSGHAFDPIIASGSEAVTIHNSDRQHLIASDQLLTLDIGAEYNHYSADLTRTFIPSKALSRQLEVFRAVQDVQTEAIKLIRPGLLVSELEKEVQMMIGLHLKHLKLIKEPSPNLIRRYYPHACSHSLGLDTHDLADYSQPLAENMVITIEPGIYIPEEGIGVRLEDDILITKNANSNLSKALPTELVI